MLAVSTLALLAVLVLASNLIWSWQRARAVRSGRAPGRLVPFLLNGAAALPAITLWLDWLLDRSAALAPLDRWLVAFAIAWIVSPFIALALTAAGDSLTRGHRRSRPDDPP